MITRPPTLLRLDSINCQYSPPILWPRSGWSDLPPKEDHEAEEEEDSGEFLESRPASLRLTPLDLVMVLVTLLLV